MRYVEPIAASNFTFLEGASHPGDVVLQAAALGLGGIGSFDRIRCRRRPGSLAARDVCAQREIEKFDMLGFVAIEPRLSEQLGKLERPSCLPKDSGKIAVGPLPAG